MVSLREQFRAQVVFFVLFGAMALLLVRLFDLQCLRFEVYERRARKQQQDFRAVPARRGKILDRNGGIFAITSTRPAVWADPGLVENVNATAAMVARTLDMPIGRLKKKLHNPRNPSNRFVWIKKEITDAQAIALRLLIKKRQVPGVYLKELQQRLYPKGALFGNVIGFCNAEGHGAEGLELKADRYLSGVGGYQITRRDNRRKRFFVPEWMRRQLEPEDGHDIHLTIDEYIQHIAEQELGKAVKEFAPRRAVALVMDLRADTAGQMLAMALWPKFDPNNRKGYRPGMLQNYAATEIFEPGSTMKVITGAIALNEGVVKLGSRVFCENGTWQVTRGHTLHDDHEMGDVSFRDVIKHSSNIGMAKTAQKLDKYTLHKYLLRFGFGKRSGMEFVSAESPGLLRPPPKWSKLSMVSIPIGHEIGVTGLQLVSAVATIANHGTRVRPTIVKRIVTSKGELAPEAREFNYFEPDIAQRNVVSPEAAALMTEAMISVTEEDGTGHRAAVPGYTVAGKTGTSQKFDKEKGAYSRRKFVASFVGFAPARDPAICVLVVVDEPKKKYYGSTVAAPVFRRICKETLAYLRIPKDAVEENDSKQEDGTI